MNTMSEAEIYARMKLAWVVLRHHNCPSSAKVLQKAMRAYAADYLDRTSESLPKAARKVRL